MKITDCNPWGSDILFVKSHSAENIMKPLLILDFTVSKSAQLENKTAIPSASLHHPEEKIKKDPWLFYIVSVTKITIHLFHIIEQKLAKATGHVYKIAPGSGWVMGFFTFKYSIMWNNK